MKTLVISSLFLSLTILGIANMVPETPTATICEPNDLDCFCTNITDKQTCNQSDNCDWIENDSNSYCISKEENRSSDPLKE